MNMTMTNAREQNRRDEEGYVDIEWATAYTTDLPIKMPYNKAKEEIVNVLEKNKIEYTGLFMEKNGITQLWQFTITTDDEITLYEFSENT